MNPKIEKIRNDIERLQNELRVLMHECEHENAKCFKSITSGGYYDDPEEYIYIKCDDCGIQYTAYKGEELFEKFKNRV